ncbi:hypothetical protein EKK58_02515 [Candidatus Dependentiae bacterium]|nr:MAG: hypothetical protein EKK58_02515 [Candidatus Dependentiae bacterium]
MITLCFRNFYILQIKIFLFIFFTVTACCAAERINNIQISPSPLNPLKVEAEKNVQEFFTKNNNYKELMNSFKNIFDENFEEEESVKDLKENVYTTKHLNLIVNEIVDDYTNNFRILGVFLQSFDQTIKGGCSFFETVLTFFKNAYKECALVDCVKKIQNSNQMTIEQLIKSDFFYAYYFSLLNTQLERVLPNVAIFDFLRNNGYAHLDNKSKESICLANEQKIKSLFNIFALYMHCSQSMQQEFEGWEDVTIQNVTWEHVDFILRSLIANNDIVNCLYSSTNGNIIKKKLSEEKININDHHQVKLFLRDALKELILYLIEKSNLNINGVNQLSTLYDLTEKIKMGQTQNEIQQNLTINDPQPMTINNTNQELPKNDQKIHNNSKNYTNNALKWLLLFSLLGNGLFLYKIIHRH